MLWLGIRQLNCWYAPKGKANWHNRPDCKRGLEKDVNQRKATEVIIDPVQLLSDAKGVLNTAPATERYAEEDA